MEVASWVFDEQPHRAILAALRLWIEDELHLLELDKIRMDSLRARRLSVLAETHDQYSNLLTQTITEQLIDVISRRANLQLLAENRALRRELAYYEAVLSQERATANFLYEWVFKNRHNIRLGGATQS